MSEAMLCNILLAKFNVSDEEVMDYYDLISDDESDVISNMKAFEIEKFELDLNKAVHSAKDILMDIKSLDTNDEEFFEEKSLLHDKLWDKVKPYLEKYVD